jgi:diguanylate cyclase (GGDEF)-like protein/PAS domain S-box-containing protein
VSRAQKLSLGSPETAGLRRLIGVVFALAAVFAASLACVWVVSGDLGMGASAIVDACAAAAAGAAWILLSRGRLTATVTIMTAGILVVAALLAAIPPATPALAALPLVGGSLALQYVSGGTLRRLLFMSWIASILVAVTVELVPVGGPLPDWSYPVMRVMSLAAVTGTTLTLLEHFGSRLRASLAESEAMRAAVEESEIRYRRAVDGLEEVVFQIDAEGRWKLLNQAWTRISGRAAEDSLDRAAAESLTLAGDGSFEERMAAVLSGQDDSLDLSMRLLTVTGDLRFVQMRARRAVGDDGVAVGLAGTLTDTTERHRLERQLTDLAFRDPLTGLPNRALFHDRVAHEITKHRRSHRASGVLFLNLNGFRVINESLGHAAGDRLLVEAARRFQTCIRPADTVAHLGVDEFGFLLEGVRHEAEAIEVAGRLLRAVGEPFLINGREIVVSASVGIAMINGATTSVELVLGRAGAAMYHAKGQHDGGYAVFKPSMRRNAMTRLEDTALLRTAIVRGDFFLEYQPIVDLATGRMKGVEALVRWRHPERGVVAPGVFIPLAEESGLIVPLGTWIISQACSQAAEWHQRWPGRLSVSINLSAIQLAGADLVKQVAEGLNMRGVDPGQIVLEITETALMADPDRALEKLLELKSLGVRLAIDDFGTGYSSLNYVSRLPVDILKLDRSFIAGLALGTSSAAMVEIFLQLGRLFNLETIAEGVETVAEAAALRAIGCQNAQGYLFARPVDAATIEGFLAADQPLPAGGTGRPGDSPLSLPTRPARSTARLLRTSA